jgi:hypothetical protein
MTIGISPSVCGLKVQIAPISVELANPGKRGASDKDTGAPHPTEPVAVYPPVPLPFVSVSSSGVKLIECVGVNAGAAVTGGEYAVVGGVVSTGLDVETDVVDPAAAAFVPDDPQAAARRTIAPTPTKATKPVFVLLEPECRCRSAATCCLLGAGPSKGLHFLV